MARRLRLRTAGAPLFAGVLLATAGLAGPAQGQEVNLQGKTINIIVNSAAGGGTDTIARLVGTAFARELPGHPALIFRNLPGGGGIQANNYFYSQVPPDGTVLLSGSRSQLSPSQLRSQAVKYNPAHYRFVGGTQRLGTVIIAHKDRAARLKTASTPPLVYGDVDGERSGLVAMVWAKAYLDWNVRFIVGYGGTSALALAARRGEIDMVADSSAANVKALENEGLVPVVQFGAPDETDKRQPRAAYPNVPIFDDLILPKLSDRALKAYKSWRDDQMVDKWLALPPKTADNIVEAYRAAYVRAAADPKVVEINRRTYGEDLPTYGGAAIDRIVAELVATEEEDLGFLISLKNKYGLPVN